MTAFAPTLSLMVDNIKPIALVSGPVLAVASYLLMSCQGAAHTPSFVLGVTLLCAIWWVFEVIPIPLTALIPLAVFPLFSILSVDDIAQSFGHQIVFLIMGGFMLSAALVQNGAHRNLALTLLNIIGTKSSTRIVIGFTIVSAILSMWISNAATAIMLVPVAIAIIEREKSGALAIPLLLAIAYGASVGGIGTPIGSPTNLIFFQAYSDSTNSEVTFFGWMLMALPPVIAMLSLVCLQLALKVPKNIAVNIPQANLWNKDQLICVVVFSCTALLWLTRNDPFGGWSAALNLPAASDGMVALLAVVLLALLPNNDGGKLLSWESAKNIPWEVLLLLAAAISLSKAFSASGLSEMMAAQLSIISALPTFLLILLICLLITFTTELVSNTATAAIFMPVLAAVAQAMETEAALLMAPAVMCASCAFMMPFATGPNAVIFGTGKVSLRTMVRYGFRLNLVSAPIVAGLCYLLLR